MRNNWQAPQCHEILTLELPLLRAHEIYFVPKSAWWTEEILNVLHPHVIFLIANMEKMSAFLKEMKYERVLKLYSLVMLCLIKDAVEEKVKKTMSLMVMLN